MLAEVPECNAAPPQARRTEPPMTYAQPPLAVRRRSYRFPRVIFALMAREMISRYSRSTGGYIWAVADPVLAIGVMSIVFSAMFRQPSIGTSFIVFFASGYIPFRMYADVQGNVMGAVRYNRALLQYPTVTPIDTVIARALLCILTLLCVDIIILAAAIRVGGTPVNLDLLVMTKALLIAAALGIGIGSVNSVAVAYSATWERVWRITTAPLMILSGVLHIHEEMPPSIADILWYNPVAHLVGYMRSGIYGAYPAHWVSLPYALSIALGAMLVGFYLLRRHRTFVINVRN
jgi:capsular polysaccharide transport system permease protein